MFAEHLPNSQVLPVAALSDYQCHNSLGPLRGRGPARKVSKYLFDESVTPRCPLSRLLDIMAPISPQHPPSSRARGVSEAGL